MIKKINFKNFFLAALIIITGILAGILFKTYNSRVPFFSENTENSLDENIQITEERSGAIANAVNKVSSAVVSIKTYCNKSNPNLNLYRKFFERFFGVEPFEKNRERISLGSGAIISDKGYILTAQHVVENADKIEVNLPDGRKFDGKVLGMDILNDLAIIKINGDNLPVIKMGNSDNLQSGEWVIAFGNPFGLMVQDPQPTVTVGVISAKMRTITVEDTNRCFNKIYGVIQTDASINPGNSGGPLVDAGGNLVGINNSIFSTSGGSQGIGFAIPINSAKKSIEDIIKYGEVKRAWLNLKIQDIPYSVKEKYNLKNHHGVIVTEIGENSNAAAAGLEKGDIITEFNSLFVKNRKWWQGYLVRLSPAKKVNLKVWDGKEEKIVSFYPKEYNLDNYLESLGIVKIKNLTYQETLDYNLRNEKGLIIKKIRNNSLVSNKKIKENDVIRMVENCKIHTKKDLNEILLKHLYENHIRMVIERNGYLYKIEMDLL
ncbi:MAG: PDZ domain-containing protein [Candidatus Mcinerneyibacterium aminivorans]|uniref:PDZ domain-containing protein n=1 Tax=Candidatus Mcinerneyibacterium aminivorans TaxID=2703815 RepID=A0A5D0MJA3_9BACT|nr:MAG: PDZ domain-containing protein [Candidatus Mcinerneyibacterium aminivorans]